MTIEDVVVEAYTIPTDFPESDGTIAWDSTTLVIVEFSAGDYRGLGYSYADISAAHFAHHMLSPLVTGADPANVPEIRARLDQSVRNAGRPGIAATAIAAVDAALWDLKAKTLNLPLVSLLGRARSDIPAYGSGGFTSYSDKQLSTQLGNWAAAGFSAVKMKIGREPGRDLERVKTARDAIGPSCELYVDANGAFTRKHALRFAGELSRFGVTWFEEPVSSDDIEGLQLMVNRSPSQIRIAAGEYGYDLTYFHRMLTKGAVDVMQADATRCGATTFMKVSALCEASHVPLSAHTAPSLHAHLCCASTVAMNVEYFHDHARIEQMLFDGAIRAVDGKLKPDMSRPGLGLRLNREAADPYRSYSSK